MREDGLIEFEGHLINPNMVANSQRGAVVWSFEKAQKYTPEQVAKISYEVLGRWRDGQNNTRKNS